MRDPKDAAEIARCAELMKDPDAVFVFGSNAEGVHGAGAAKAAIRYGAKRGIGDGPSGRTYAIPTKRTWREPGLSIEWIRVGVEGFLNYAICHPERVFVVTRIGCGYAGYHDRDIAPLFKDAPANCELPPAWRA